MMTKWRPGRELDRFIAEQYFKMDVDAIKRSHVNFLPFYSTTFDDAWKIVESLRQKPPQTQEAFLHNIRIMVSKKTNTRFSEVTSSLLLWATPIDICLAALQVEGKL